MDRAFEVALESERAGNLPIGAVIAHGSHVVCEGRNGVMVPFFHPGRHAEMDALSNLEEMDLARSRDLALYVTLEPCVMCLGSTVLHRIAVVYFAAADPDRGASYLLPSIGQRYPERYLPKMQGPMDEERGASFFARARDTYRLVRPD